METKSQGYMSERWHDDSAAPSGVVSNFEETWVDAAYVNKLEADNLALRTRLETAMRIAQDLLDEVDPCWQAEGRKYCIAHGSRWPCPVGVARAEYAALSAPESTEASE